MRNPLGQQQVRKDGLASVWWEITTALVYPAVVGALIFNLLAMSVEWVKPAGEASFGLQALGAPKGLSVLLIMLITLGLAWHFSADYMYSKYSVATYAAFHFVVDVIVCGSLAVGFTMFTSLAAGSAADVLHSFAWLWSAMALVYFSFVAWDLRDYLYGQSGPLRLADFFRRMIARELAIGLASVAIAVAAIIAPPRVPLLWLFCVWTIIAFLGVAFWLWRQSKELRRTFADPMAGVSVELTPGTLIRPALQSDIDEAADLMSTTYRAVYDEPWSQQSSRARLDEIWRFDPDFCYVAVDAYGLAGIAFARRYQWYTGECLWIEEIVVRDDVRGEGLGSLILSFLMNRAEAASLSGFSLLSKRDSSAAHFYRRHGFADAEWQHLEALNPNQQSSPRIPPRAVG